MASSYDKQQAAFQAWWANGYGQRSEFNEQDKRMCGVAFAQGYLVKLSELLPVPIEDQELVGAAVEAIAGE